LAKALRRAVANEEDPKTDLELFFVLLKQMTVNGRRTIRVATCELRTTSKFLRPSRRQRYLPAVSGLL
jgi:hypothetical protein